MPETFEVELDRMVAGGYAMGRHAGRTVFISHALPGERVRAQVTDDRGRILNAVPLEILRRSPARVEPRCLHAVPGGAGPDEWQIISYEQQLIYKREVVTDQLQRVGKIEKPLVRSIPAAPDPWGYRRNMTFVMSREGELGFWSTTQRRVVPVDTCYLMHPALQDLYAELDLSAPGIGKVRFVMGSKPDDRMIVLEMKEDIEPEIETDLPVSINLLLADHEPVNLIGSPQVSYHLFDRVFQVTAGSFFYPNLEVTAMLIEEVLRRLDLTGEEDVLELYSGVGTLTAFLAERADMVVSVESYPPSVSDADVNLGDIENVELVEGGVESVLEELVGPFDAVVAAPPPAGMSDDVIEALVRLTASRIVYVSADPASLGRDAQRLAAQGKYKLIDVQPLDMEPQTPHAVSVALLQK
jgi:23S rRNA (uracil1939-C5)-methyltransferase